MYQFLMLIHVFAAVFIVALVLVQQGKGATMGAAFGSGASQTVFGSRGSGSFLYRITMSLIIIFFVTSIALNNIATRAYKETKVITLPATPQQSIPVKPSEVKVPEPAAAKTGGKTLPEGIPTKK